MGAESGTPGTFRWEGREVFPVDPTGGGLCVAVVFADSTVLDVRDMILDVRTGETMHKTKPDTAWVFAGSKFVEHNGREVYASDGTGIIVGLATFGTELAGYAQTFSHESEAETPVWIADAASTPEVGSHVRVRLSLMR